MGDKHLDSSKELLHYGTPRHSGRYPFGSGDNPYQRAVTFQKTVKELRDRGMDNKEIARSMDMTTRQFRNRVGVAEEMKRSYMVSECIKLRDKGMSPTAIGRRLGIRDTSVRSYLDAEKKERTDLTKKNADILRKQVELNKYVDVTSTMSLHMGITKERLDKALTMLEMEGYGLYNVKVRQLSTGHDTTIRVLCPPKTEFSEAYAHRNDAKPPVDLYSEDCGKTLRQIEPPKSISSSRVMVRYDTDVDVNGAKGIERDGVIQLRRGVDDISLGNAKYAQVRILVDGTHYIKGMAMYSDDMPDGYDIVFNTNKTHDVPMMGSKDNSVLKPIKKDPSNPFGATIQDDEHLIRAQRHYIDKDGNEQLSALNIVREEGQWNEWSKTLASQFLSKQYPALAKQQLDISRKVAKEEFDEIMSLTNPVVKADLLEQFAGKCDSAATDLSAAALPRQTTKVILPIPSMKDDEIYCPNLHDGETVALVRYPHGGPTEIPVLRVNNQHKPALDIMGNADDACGVSAATAERLSGADFDGDTCIVLPIDNVKIKTEKLYSGLVGFDPKRQYKAVPGMAVMSKAQTGAEMGKITNLITDMYIMGAGEDELVRAIKHSMVVIDAEKHKLNYKQSELDNDIAGLKLKWRGRSDAGASTLLSLSTSKEYMDEREKKRFSRMSDAEKQAYKDGYDIYRKTGKVVSQPKMHTVTKTTINPDGSVSKEKVKEEVLGPDGKKVWVKTVKQDKVERMMLTNDAYTLTSKLDPDAPHGANNTTQIERIYADHANAMKAIAIEARKQARMLPSIEKNKSAAEMYDTEVRQLESQLLDIDKLRPLENQAQMIANKKYQQLFYDNPSLRFDKDKVRKEKQRMIREARELVGLGKKKQIILTDRQWEAINAGALSKTTLKKVLQNSDNARVKELAMPRKSVGMSAGKIEQAKSLMNRGYQQDEVADMLGVSVTTMLRAINPPKK